MNEVLDPELAYMAGLFDGEGHVSIRHRTQGATNPHPRHAAFLGIGIANTQRLCVELFHAHFGGAIHKAEAIPNRKPIYRCTVGENKAEFALRQLLPYLRLKRPQAEFALRFQAIKREGWPRGRGVMVGQGHWHRPQESWDQLDAMATELREMNRHAS